MQALDSIKKAGSRIPKDDAKRLEKEVSCYESDGFWTCFFNQTNIIVYRLSLQVDEITKRFVKSAEEICKAKDKEISGNSR